MAKNEHVKSGFGHTATAYKLTSPTRYVIWLFGEFYEFKTQKALKDFCKNQGVFVQIKDSYDKNYYNRFGKANKEPE